MNADADEQRMRRLIAVTILLAKTGGSPTLVPSVLAAQEAFDLGGPCSPGVHPGPLAEIRRAKQSGSWDRVIELEKQSVREGCGVAYRWLELANSLVEAGRQRDALAAVTEMEARGFDLNPALIGE